MAPIDGVAVAALEQAVSAQVATRQLADLGAPVIKIDLCNFLVWLNDRRNR